MENRKETVHTRKQFIKNKAGVTTTHYKAIKKYKTKVKLNSDANILHACFQLASLKTCMQYDEVDQFLHQQSARK